MNKILVFGDTSTWNINDFSISKIRKDILQDIKDSDLVVYNLEGPIIEAKNNNYRLQLRENYFLDIIFKSVLKIFKKEQPLVSSDEKIISLLKLNKNTVVTLANNHIKDFGRRGFDHTVELLERNNIKYIGAGINNRQASEEFLEDDLVIINVNWISSKKMNLPFKIYNANKHSYGASFQSVDEMKTKIEKYKKKGKKVFLILHGGTEMPSDENQIGIDLGKIMSIGADVSIIHHFHKYVQTKYEQENIFCLGDFIFCRPGNLDPSRPSSSLKINTKEAKIIEYKMSDIYPYEN